MYLTDTAALQLTGPTVWVMVDRELDPLGRVPLYQQLADLIAEQIEAGDLEPNRPLPSELTLQQRYGVSRDTVRHALRALRTAGLVESVRGKGTYVLERD